MLQKQLLALGIEIVPFSAENGVLHGIREAHRCWGHLDAVIADYGTVAGKGGHLAAVIKADPELQSAFIMLVPASKAKQMGSLDTEHFDACLVRPVRREKFIATLNEVFFLRDGHRPDVDSTYAVQTLRLPRPRVLSDVPYHGDLLPASEPVRPDEAHGSLAISPIDAVLHEILSGVAAEEIQSRIQGLKPDSRQALLCKVCSIQSDIAETSLDHGREAGRLLSAECRWFIDGRATCSSAKDTIAPLFNPFAVAPLGRGPFAIPTDAALNEV